MLTLPIKKQWYDMILRREKVEEYRELKEYYTARFVNILAPYSKDEDKNFEAKMIDDFISECRIGWFEDEHFKVMFRNGYGTTSPSIIADCTLRVGTGKVEWGAEPGKQYYVLTIQEILDS